MSESAVSVTETIIERDVSLEIAPERPSFVRGFRSALANLARTLARDGEPDDFMVEPPLPPVPEIREYIAAVPVVEATPINTIRNSLMDLLEHLSDDVHPAPLASAPVFTMPPRLEPKQLPAQAAVRWVMEESETGIPRHAILSGKTIGVVGFTEEGMVALGQRLAAQHCSFLALTHADAEFRKGSTTSCDVLIVDVRPEWAAHGSGEVSTLLTTKKPVVLIGDRTTLSNVAIVAQGGPRDFVPQPSQMDELVWRTSILLSRIPGPKIRGNSKKKGRHFQVVIGDNDPSSRTLVHAVLAQEGMQCHAADNGAQALALARAKCADAVVLDVNMPGLDGFQVLAELKRDPAFASMKVILLTTRQAEADVLRGFGLGADDYVTKPFSPLELAARVKRLLARQA